MRIHIPLQGVPSSKLTTRRVTPGNATTEATENTEDLNGTVSVLCVLRVLCG